MWNVDSTIRMTRWVWIEKQYSGMVPSVFIQSQIPSSSLLVRFDKKTLFWVISCESIPSSCAPFQKMIGIEIRVISQTSETTATWSDISWGLCWYSKRGISHPFRDRWMVKIAVKSSFPLTTNQGWFWGNVDRIGCIKMERDKTSI